MRTPARVFISYAHEDERYRDQLEAALAGLSRAEKVSCWHDRNIRPGSEWGDCIVDALDEADVILLLISNDFQRSDYITSEEVPRAMERHRQGSAVVIPVIVRPTDWSHSPYAALEAVPDNAKPVSNWNDRDSAWLNVVQRITETLTGPPPLVMGRHSTAAHPRPNLAPDPPVNFIGRDRIADQVVEALASSSRLTILRSGTGGIGKTSLAAHVARRVGDSFSAGVLWARVDAEETASIMRSFLTACGSPSTSEGSLAQRYRLALANRSYLIVLDNAESAAQVAPLVPTAGPSRVLVTTRYGISANLDDAAEIPVAPLSGEDASRFLQFLVGESAKGDSGQWSKLAQELGRLPLALKIAAANIRELRWPAASYLDRLRRARNLSWPRSEGEPGLRQSFAVNYHHLPSDHARTAFRALGAFAAAVRPEELSCASMFSMVELDELLLDLSRYGVIELSSESLVYVHPLLQRYAAELLEDAGEASSAHLRVGTWYRSRLGSWDVSAGAFSSFGRADDDDAVNGLTAALHFESARTSDEAQETLVGVADAITRRGDDVQLWSILQRLRAHGTLQHWLELYWATLALQLNKHACVDEARKVLVVLASSGDGKLASAALIALGRDAISHDELGEAAAHLTASLRLKEQTTPRDDRGISYILNELGRLAMRTASGVGHALDLHNRALSIQRSLDDAQGEGYTLRRIASVHLHASDDASAALAVLADAESLAVECNFMPLLIAVLVEKAEALSRLEKFRSAVDELKRARQVAAKIENPYAAAKVLRRIGVVYERTELYGQALSAFQESARLYETLDPKQIAAARRSVVRLEGVVRQLKREEQELADREMAANLAETRFERAAARRLRRIRQQLGELPALIRLGTD
jgi:hypothetical protein